MMDQQKRPGDEEEDERDRRATNIFLLVTGILVVGGGIWLVNALADTRKAQLCFKIRPTQLQSDTSAGADTGLMWRPYPLRQNRKRPRREAKPAPHLRPCHHDERASSRHACSRLAITSI